MAMVKMLSGPRLGAASLNLARKFRTLRCGFVGAGFREGWNDIEQVPGG